MPTLDEIEQTAQRKDIIRVRCIKIPNNTDPLLTDRAVRRFEISRIYDAEYMLDSKIDHGWIIQRVAFKKREVREYFEVVE